MTLYYFCYAPPAEGAAESLAEICEPTQRTDAGRHRLSFAVYDPRILLHDVKAIG